MSERKPSVVLAEQIAEAYAGKGISAVKSHIEDAAIEILAPLDAVVEALTRAGEWSAGFPLEGLGSIADRAAAADVHVSAQAALQQLSAHLEKTP